MSVEKKMHNQPLVGLIVCGPCACGKSEVASALAHKYQVPFVDADSFHPEENIKKMSSGIPLTDEDRFPWLVTVRQQMILQKKTLSEDEGVTSSQQPHQQVGVVAACSALTKTYRDILGGRNKQIDQDELSVIFVFLNCSEEILQTRLNKRQGHFMKANMLSSQLATLEVPNKDETGQGHAIIVNGDVELASVTKEVTEKIQDILKK